LPDGPRGAHPRHAHHRTLSLEAVADALVIAAGREDVPRVLRRTFEHHVATEQEVPAGTRPFAGLSR
jgi:hypothetical protein